MKAPTGTYHSAHYNPADAEPMTRAVFPNGTAFTHDLLTAPLPQTYDSVDVIYTDLPWARGFREFNARAGVTDGRTYADLMRVVSHETRRPAPSILVTGRHARDYLPQPDQAIRLALNEHDAVAYIYGTDDLPPVSSATALLDILATRYDVVGDYCCGYGSAAAAFTRARKQFIVSDLNPLCIGHIYRNHRKWVNGV